MTVHVLHAGDGYSYLTNQVAAGDQQVRRSEELTDYYTAEGAKPGQWWGNGLASLGVSGQVSTAQMQALFGEGLRPDATAFIQEQIAAGASASEAIDAARLGRRFMTTNDPDTEWQAQVHAASVAFEREHQRAPQDAELSGIKSDVAATMLQKSLRRPATSDEVSWFVALRVPDWKQQVSRGYQAFRDEVGRSPETGPERDLVKHDLAADHLRASLGRDATTGEIARFLTERGAPARQPVAGYDLVFSPVKSVSVLWALADRDDPREAHIAREVHAAHEAAWQGAMTWFEQEAAYTRTGAGGVAQMKTNGLLVAAFEHRDSRTGDPDLHTHVAVSTKVQGVDGKWRSADGRMFHNLGVAASERYNSLVEQELRNRLGLQFVEETRGQDKRGVREVMGVDKGMRDGFSSRRVGIEQAYSELVDEYVAAHGHTPPKNIQHKLYEQANLATREGKAPPSSEETQVAEWRQAAREHVQVDGWAAGVVAQSRAMPAQDSLAAASVEQLGALVVARVEQDRSTWKDSHLQAEADRLARRVAQVTGQDVQALADDVTKASLRRSVSLAPPELNPIPAQLRHDTGESVLRVHRSDQYTSEKTLRTEEAVLTAVRTRGGFAVSEADFRVAIERFNARAVADGQHALNASQLALARQFATGGHRIETGIGPAGAGKTTAMRATIYAVEAGGGRVLALGTTGKAAQVLGRELGTDADTAHMLIQAHATAKRTGQPVADRYRIDQNTVLLLDEASMAGNPEFGRLLALADEHGAALRPLGDPGQNGSIGAGGILRLLDRETDVARLTEVHRFTGEHGQDEAAASLKVRAGDATGLDFYIEHGRVFAGTRDEVMDRIYTDWKRDTDAGKASLMIAGTNEEVSALNARARADRVDAGAVEESGRLLADGNTVGVGDTILTRSTERSLRVNQGKDWVTNQDMWTVTAVSPYGVMAKHHVHGGTVTLPLDYVSEHVQLGYAHTDYGVQGDTVTTGGVVIDPATTTREGLYVPSTRGKEENRLYVVIDKPLDGGHTDDERENSVRGALEQVLARERATKSATEVMRTEQNTAHSLTTLLPQYDHGRVTVLDPKAIERAEQAVRDALPAELASRIVADEAWSTFAARLVDHDLAGTALQDRLQGLVRPRDLDTIDPIESPARVYWWRLGPATTIGTDLEPVDGLPKWVTPFNDRIGDPEVRTWLHGQQELMRDRITSLVDQVVAEPPAWAEPFGRVPADPAQAEQWRENMGRIVAYREAFEVPASETVLSEEPRGAHAVQAWQDARAAGLDIRTQQDRLGREQASAAALERMGIDPTSRTTTTSTATLPETAVVVDVDRLLEQKPAWVAQYGTQPAEGEARETWREQIATVAAYREAQGVPNDAYRLTDPGMVDRNARHAFAAAEQAHEDLRRTGWMRDRDGAERNTAGPVPAAETTVANTTEAAPSSSDRTAAADSPERSADEPTSARPGDGPADPPVTTPAAEPVDTAAPDASEAIRRLANDPDALADALRRRQEAATAREAAAQAAREAVQQAEATKRNTYDQSAPRQDQNGPQRHM
ncbi:MobF family relaxase [Curtobacterium sp. PhB25]|uniref:MobF family relaxase n=1 Tax=Curtobacterium sp. PhB25 TaxID=2485205 RepID=UPI001066D6CC|nr:MobF family relaxase [Curtobacterium sp. PhB25]